MEVKDWWVRFDVRLVVFLIFGFDDEDESDDGEVFKVESLV